MGNTLILRLQGALQAWGESSHYWKVRKTGLLPTKSGIVGLLGAALGTQDLAAIGRRLQMGIRVDKPGQVIRDYHTVTSGILDARGKLKKDYNLVTHRFYLSDAAFTVALRGEPAYIESLAAAVQAPVWPLYLGRRSCVPSAPIYADTGDFPGLWEALSLSEERMYEIEGQGELYRQDELMAERVFAMRQVNRFVA